MATNSFQRPTKAELLSRIQADLEGAVTGITARLRRRFEFGLARAHMGVADGLHGHLSWVARQIFPDTAEEVAVLRYANLFLQPTPRRPASQAQGSGSVTGSGGNLTVGTQLVRPSDGSLYTVDTTLTSITTAQTVNYTAVEPGAAGTIQSGDVLQTLSPVTNVDSVIASAASTAAGTDLETIPAVLERLLDVLAEPARGGAPGDHVTWAKEVTGVTRAWEYTFNSHPANVPLGETYVYFVVSDAPGDDPIPGSSKIAEVQAYLDALSGSKVTVFAPTAEDFDVTATLNPLSASAAAEAEINDMLLRDAEPGGTILLSRLNEAISIAAGEIDHVVTIPAADKSHAFGTIAVPGTYTLS